MHDAGACSDIYYSHHPEYGNLLLGILIVVWALIPALALKTPNAAQN
jgi:hypothetical protein